MKHKPPKPTLFPYTTLFRSSRWTVAAATSSCRAGPCWKRPAPSSADRKSTRLNSSHQIKSYAVFCLKKKNKEETLLSGPTHEDLTLLQRLLVCGRCVRSITIRYQGHGGIYPVYLFCFFFFNDTATTEIYTLSLHDALPI